MKSGILKEFGLENFRVFMDKTSFELAPINLLTGPNSSGKSSMIKALKLMQNFHKNNCYERGFKSPILDFREDDSHAYHHQLGDFEYVINDENTDIKELSVFYKIPLNIGRDFKHPTLLKGIEKTLVETLKKFEGFDGSLTVEQTFSLANYSDIKNGELIKSSIYAEYGKEKIKLIEWHTDTWPSSGYDIESNTSIEFEDSKWDYYVDYVAIIKFILMCNSNLEELLKQFNVSNDPKIINQIPQSIRDLVDNYFGNNSKNNIFAINVMLLSDEKLINFEHEVWKNLVKCNPKKLKLLTFEDFVKAIKKLDEDLYQFDPNWLNNPFLIPAEMILIFKKNKSALLTIKDYVQNPFLPITDCNEQKRNFVENESYDQWISVLNYLDLLEYYIINSGENVISDFHKKNKNKYENYYLSYHYKNVKQPEFLSAFSEEINKFIDSALEMYFTECEFIEATKANTQRLYTFISQGTSFNKYLADYIDRAHNEEIEQFFNKWLNEFEIGERLDLESGLIRGVGVQLNVLKGDKPRNIVEFGYGVTQMIALILRIVSAIDTGKTTVIVEEPESNLHPKLQSKLADLFVDANQTFGLNFIVETHSEYLIRKLQYLTAKNEITSTGTTIYYFGNQNSKKREQSEDQVIRIYIKENGELNEPFGTGFFDEADNLAMELWSFK